MGEHWPEVTVVSVTRRPGFDSAAARNIGAAAARGKWLILIAADMRLNRGFTECLARTACEGDFMVATPREHDRAGLMVVECDAFRRAGGADPQFAGSGHGDDDLIMALHALGLRGRTIGVQFIGEHLQPEEETRDHGDGGGEREGMLRDHAARFVAKWGSSPPPARARIPWTPVNPADLVASREPEPFPGHRLGMAQLFLLPEADAFNGALLETPKGKLLVYRSPPGCACVLLDENYAFQPGTHQALDLWRNDDPRLVACGLRIYLSSSYHGGGFRRERVELRELLPETGGVEVKIIGKFETVEGDPAYVRVREKNWAPFDHEGRLLYVHKVRPHRILEVDLARGAVRLLHEEAWELPAWWLEEWGRDLRLNTPPLRLDAGRYLSTFHTWHHRGYRTWFYTFAAEPPFAVQAISAEPVLLSQDARGRNLRNRRNGCVFVTGLQIYRERDEVLLTGGNNDSCVVMVPLRLSAVVRSLRSTPGPAGETLTHTAAGCAETHADTSSGPEWSHAKREILAVSL